MGREGRLVGLAEAEETLLVTWGGLEVGEERGYNSSNKILEVVNYREHILGPEVRHIIS